MMITLIQNVIAVNQGESRAVDVVIENQKIKSILPPFSFPIDGADECIVAKPSWRLLPGAIDDQVHFREPGLTHKATIYSESRAAVAGGITSFMEMPNTVPNAVTLELLEEKYAKAEFNSLANYSFFMGTTSTNLPELLKVDPKTICGVKIFMGSSTGNMLVDNEEVLNKVFKEVKTLIATHCEDDVLIRERQAMIQAEHPHGIPVHLHPIIRNHEACFKSSSKAVRLAKKHDTQLHILHISTAQELELFTSENIQNKRITSEACFHHLWFSDHDYHRLGSRIKWNPAVKTMQDMLAIREAINDGRIDVIATDHAPHTWEEKQHPYPSCPSGAPLVQHALIGMLELVHRGVFTLEKVVEKMSHNVATLFHIPNRGFIQEGFQADLVLVDLESPWTVTDENSLYQCRWTPLVDTTFQSRVLMTWVNGHKVFDHGTFHENTKGQRLEFNR